MPVKVTPTSHGRTLVYDIESNGFLDKVTKVWCFYFIDMDTQEGFLFHDFDGFCGAEGYDDDNNHFVIPVKSGSLRDGAIFAQKAKSLICHNQLSYDQPLIQKFWPKFKKRFAYPEMRDTLLESQIFWYDRRPVKGHKGIHGLDPWGARLGVRKPPINDWSEFDIYKLNRCIQDVEINRRVAIELYSERDLLKKECGIEFDQALKIEHEYRHWCSIQERNGALVDQQHMESCIIDLDDKLDTLKELLEPELPPSISMKGGKVTKHDLFKALGYTKKIPVEYIYKEHAGEMKQFAVKQWWKPCTKWTKVDKGKMYGIVAAEIKQTKKTEGRPEEELLTPSFTKLKDARDYAKELWPDIKKFKYPSIEHNVVSFDSHCINHFEDLLDSEDFEIVGNHTKLETLDSRMSQHERVKLYLLGLGWQTDEWTFKTDADGAPERAEHGGVAKWPTVPLRGKQLTMKYKAGDKIHVTPKVTEDSYMTLPDGLGDNIKHFNAYSHRRNFIQNKKDHEKGLLNNIREDGRITCGLMTFGTTAGRASHSGWVNAPGLKAIYGEQIRKIIIAPEGSTLIGIDMPSAHPRLLADFTQNATFIAAVDGHEVDPVTGKYLGEDFHTVNSVLFKLNSQEDVDEAIYSQDHDLILVLGKKRGKGKGGSYATLYGGSGMKIAMTLGLPLSEGEALKQNFLAGLGLDELLAEINLTWKAKSYKRGSWISVLGGYHVWCASKHKIINYKALGSEAVVQKVAINLINRKLEAGGFKTMMILGMHDETLFEVPNNELEAVKPLISNMYKEAALDLGLTLDWTSAAMEGMNYAECH